VLNADLRITVFFSRRMILDAMSCRDRNHKLVGILIGAFLFAAPAAFVLWQNTHLTVLWDLSYILENATRISLGQRPYRDFPFPYAPLTFLMQATIIKLFGRAVFHHYLYAAFTAGLGSLLTWRILRRVMPDSQARLIAFLLSVPLVFLGTSSIFPHPFYDSDCTLFMLFCAWWLLRLESSDFPAFRTFLCGALLVIPLFIKQNTGLAFLLSAAVCVILLGLRNRRAAALLLSGTAAGVAFAGILVQHTVGVANYFHWTIAFAASRRLPGLTTMLGVYRDPALIWPGVAFALGIALFVIPQLARKVALRWLGATLLSVPFLVAVAELHFQDNASDRVEALLRLWPVLLIASLVLSLWQLRRGVNVARLLPLILLGSIHGAFLSQQLWGSTYALWPLLMILIGAILAALVQEKDADRSGMAVPLTAFATVACVALLVAGGYYALSHERLDYADLSGDTLVRSSLPALRGLRMRGHWLPDFEELVVYSEREIPWADAILEIPGEDLFYFTTGRTPQFPVILMDNTVNPYNAAEIAALARQRNVRWLIVKRELQLQEQPLAFRPQLLELLSRDFSLAESLDNYEIYRRKE
jgi:hypothetical protein